MEITELKTKTKRNARYSYIFRRGLSDNGRSCGVRGDLPNTWVFWEGQRCTRCGRGPFDHPSITTLNAYFFPPFTGSLCPFAAINERLKK